MAKDKVSSFVQRFVDSSVSAAVRAIETFDSTIAGHSQRVAVVTVSLARHVDAITRGPLRDLHFSADQLRAIECAGLLHDIGKLGVPKALLFKEKKLPRSRMETIEARFKYAIRTLEAERLRAQVDRERSGASTAERWADTDEQAQRELDELARLLEVVRLANEPSASEVDASALDDLTRRTYPDLDGSRQPLLTAHECAALSTQGLYSIEERDAILGHVENGHRILSAVAWREAYREIPEIVLTHHEYMDGSGYPRGLSGSEIPIESRMMAIANVYDALVAGNQPNKNTIHPEVALDILDEEAKKGRVDAGLLEVFIDARIWADPEFERLWRPPRPRRS
jgi:HD-GYP domain-containing protein (c-di-GMP phosphodiesterase class II)